jgi:protein-S-isoprenylcysteine O-methyltransferase Ste14
MRLFPVFRLSIANGWLLLIAYFLGLTLNVLTFPRDKRKKLFLEPSYPRGDWRRLVRLVGTVVAILYVVTMIFAPLRTGSALLYVGLAIYLSGFALVMVSVVEYRGAPVDRPVTSGIYRVSRNPQWIGLVLVYLGAAIAVASWLHLALLAVLVTAYHFQILLEERICLQSYGEEFRTYMKQVHRYVGF